MNRNQEETSTTISDLEREIIFHCVYCYAYAGFLLYSPEKAILLPQLIGLGDLIIKSTFSLETLEMLPTLPKPVSQLYEVVRSLSFVPNHEIVQNVILPYFRKKDEDEKHELRTISISK